MLFVQCVACNFVKNNIGLLYLFLPYLSKCELKTYQLGEGPDNLSLARKPKDKTDVVV